MRALVISRPLFPVPQAQLPQLVQALAEWRRRYASRLEVFELFAGGGGGFAVVNAADEAAFHQMIMEYPFGAFNRQEVYPCVDGDVGIRQLQQALNASAAPGRQAPTS